MDTDDLKLSKAASKYIERRAAFWLMENDPELCLEDFKEETLNLCLEDLYREWVELARSAVETVNERVGFDIRLRINVDRIRDDFAFLSSMHNWFCRTPEGYPKGDYQQLITFGQFSRTFGGTTAVVLVARLLTAAGFRHCVVLPKCVLQSVFRD